MAPPEAQPSLKPRLPQALGRFTLCEELGAGGMATVYLSKMRLGAGLDRLVALKTIHSHLAKEQTFVDMFLDEARIASHISHPHVCAVYDFGQEGDVYFLAMEYLIGEPVFDFINRVAKLKDESDELMEALPFLAARILGDACEGLHAAHTLKGSDGKAQNVVHRDVSPQNLFITYEGTVKVVDFGCAKALERVTQTNTGIMKGKVSYAAPEQLRAESVDARADVFALGICLWETLTLRSLFRRDTAIKTAMAVLESDIPRADEKAPWVPKELADIAEKALQRDVNERYQSARELSRALRGFIAHSGAPFESAEVADWMRFLFEERHAKTMKMVSDVEGLDTSRIARIETASPPVIDSAPTVLATPPRATAPALDVEPQAPVSLPTSTRKWMTLVVLLLLGGAALWFFQGDAILAAMNAPEEEVEPPETTDTEPDELAPPDMIVEPDEISVTPSENMEALSPREQAAAEARRERRRRRREEAAEEARLAAESMEAEEFTTGSVRVRAIGGTARVRHDGQDLGATPVRATLPVGPQVLEIIPDGNAPRETVTVTIEPGTLQTINIRLEDVPPPSMNPEPLETPEE
ncbi:MAG: serine/threonine-protein kinase [Myxococcota bacterium]